jgi:ATP-dependent exoDNAse (exonuclease V) beta subunit
MNNIQYSVLDGIYAETSDTERIYYIPDKNLSYPSITTILGATAYMPWLDKWREKVGIEEANRISKEATDRGEAVHTYLERYWNGEQEEVLKESSQDTSFYDIAGMTKRLINATEKGVEKVYMQEAALYSKNLGFAGRVDMVGNWRGTDAIIDFKTSKKRKYASNIKDFFLQVSGYAEAHNELFGTEINKLVILITVQDEEKCQAFYSDRRKHINDLKYRINEYGRL